MIKNLFPILLFSFLFTTVNFSCKDKSEAPPQDSSTEVISKKAYKNIDVLQAKAIFNGQSDVVWLDVRTPEEIAQGQIANSISIDFRGDNFEKQVDALDKSKSYIVYCRSGGRSANASEMMVGKGFQSVQNMKGGYTAWQEKQ